MFKKLIAFLLIACCMFAFFSCGDKSGDTDGDNSDDPFIEDENPDGGNTGDGEDDGEDGGNTDDGEDGGEDDGTTGGNTGGDDSVLADLQDKFINFTAEEATDVEITYTSADGLVSETIDCQITADGEADVLSIPYFNYVDISASGTIVMPEDISGNYTAKPASKTVDLNGITFKKEYLKDGAYTFERNKFSAVVTNCTGFFGATLTQGEVSIEITVTNSMPKKVVMEYTTDQGYLVNISIKYGY